MNATAYIKNTTNQKIIAEHEFNRQHEMNLRINAVWKAHDIDLTEPQHQLVTTPPMPRHYADPNMPDITTTIPIPPRPAPDWPW